MATAEPKRQQLSMSMLRYRICGRRRRSSWVVVAHFEVSPMAAAPLLRDEGRTPHLP